MTNSRLNRFLRLVDFMNDYAGGSLTDQQLLAAGVAALNRLLRGLYVVLAVGGGAMLISHLAR